MCLDFVGKFPLKWDKFVTGMKINIIIIFFSSRNGAAAVWGQRFLYQRI